MLSLQKYHAIKQGSETNVQSHRETEREREKQTTDDLKEEQGDRGFCRKVERVHLKWASVAHKSFVLHVTFYTTAHISCYYHDRSLEKTIIFHCEFFFNWPKSSVDNLCWQPQNYCGFKTRMFLTVQGTAAQTVAFGTRIYDTSVQANNPGVTRESSAVDNSLAP